MAQQWESSWLNIESQIDSTLRVKLIQHCESNWLKYFPVTHFSRSNYISASDSLLRSKWLNFFSRCTERKILSFWPKKLGQISVPPVTQLLGSKWLNFFSWCTERKIESFWPKKLGRILIPPVTQKVGSNFRSSSDSTFKDKMTIFSLGALREKNWVILT